MTIPKRTKGKYDAYSHMANKDASRDYAIPLGDGSLIVAPEGPFTKVPHLDGEGNEVKDSDPMPPQIIDGVVGDPYE